MISDKARWGCAHFIKRQSGVPRSSLCSYNIRNKVWFFSIPFPHWILSLSLPHNSKDLEFSGIDSFKVFQATHLQIGKVQAHEVRKKRAFTNQ
uniref:Uncharacterized protein n=1 Tax=Salix viminalis TaxID=40686 RepID=A0A6N2LSE2_SALVM